MQFGSFMDSLNQGMGSSMQLIAALQDIQEKRRKQQGAGVAFKMGGAGGQRPSDPNGVTVPPFPQQPQQQPGLLGRGMNSLAGLFSGSQAGGMGGMGGGGGQGGGMQAPALPGVSPGQIPMAPPGPWGGGGGGAPGGGGMPQMVGNQPQGGGQGADDFSPQAWDRQIMQIASDIRQRNPGIDDETLAEAVSQRVAMLSKVGAMSNPMERAYAAQMTSRDRQDVLAERAARDKKRGEEADARLQAALDKAKADQGYKTASLKERGREADARVSTQKYTADLASQWHIRGQDMTHDDKQASIAAGLERSRYVQDAINDRFAAGELDKVHRDAAVNQVRSLTARMNAAQRIMNGIQNANPDADLAKNPEYAKAEKDYEDAAGALDYVDQQVDKDAKGKTADAGPVKPGKPPVIGAALPKDLPPPKGLKDGTKAKDGQGKVVAVIKAGQWVAP